MSIADNIRYLREKFGLTQNELGEIAGLTGKAVQAWESGRAEPRMGAVENMAQYFGIPKSVLIDEKLPVKNIIMPNAYSIPILDRISCGSGSSINHEYAGEFVLDRSIKADYCLIASGDSMIDAGIEDGDRVFMRKVTEYKDGKIYGVVLRSEDTATLKRVYFQEDKVLLQPCNPSYKPVCLSESEVYIVGECIGIFKTI